MWLLNVYLNNSWYSVKITGRGSQTVCVSCYSYNQFFFFLFFLHEDFEFLKLCSCASFSDLRANPCNTAWTSPRKEHLAYKWVINEAEIILMSAEKYAVSPPLSISKVSPFPLYLYTGRKVEFPAIGKVKYSYLTDHMSFTFPTSGQMSWW